VNLLKLLENQMRDSILKNAMTLLVLLLVSMSLAIPVNSTAAGTPPPIDPCVCDIDGDGRVSITDIVLFAEDFFSANYDARSDFDGSGTVDLTDVAILAQALGTFGC
jgi:hypothetical protein